MSDKNVHAEHCCKEHGCKYSEQDCPVVTGEMEQSHPCQDCQKTYPNGEPVTKDCIQSEDWYPDYQAMMEMSRGNPFEDYKGLLHAFIEDFMRVHGRDTTPAENIRFERWAKFENDKAQKIANSQEVAEELDESDEVSDLWERNDIQFPRLISEIIAAGVPDACWEEVVNSMDITYEELNELQDRAQKEWERIKKR